MHDCWWALSASTFLNIDSASHYLFRCANLTLPLFLAQFGSGLLQCCIIEARKNRCIPYHIGLYPHMQLCTSPSLTDWLSRTDLLTKVTSKRHTDKPTKGHSTTHTLPGFWWIYRWATDLVHSHCSRFSTPQAHPPLPAWKHTKCNKRETISYISMHWGLICYKMSLKTVHQWDHYSDCKWYDIRHSIVS